MSPRTQADRSEATRLALIEAATSLFAEKGFRATSTEEIVARAGVTRGALYHHFRDKKELFQAVYETLQNSKTGRIAEAMSGDDVIASVTSGIHAYLHACRDPIFQRVCHVEAPSVLSWDEWRARTTEHSLGIIGQGMQRAIDAGLIENRSAEVLAHIVHGAILEAGMLVSGDDSVDIADVEQTLIQFLMGFMVTPVEG